MKPPRPSHAQLISFSLLQQSLIQFFSDTHILLQLLVFSSLDCELFKGRAHVLPSIAGHIGGAQQTTHTRQRPCAFTVGFWIFCVCLLASFEVFEV